MTVGEWDERQLCADGACVGVIGPDGTCKACGRAAPNWGDERKRGLIDPADDDLDEDADDGEAEDAEHGLAAHDDDDEGEGDDGEADDDDGYDDVDEDDEDEVEDDVPEPALVPSSKGAWASRQLCSDGACIGVIGADGTCKVCGREPASSPADEATAGAASTSDDHDGAAPGVVAAGAACSAPGCAGVRGADGGCTTCGAGSA